MNKSLLRLSGAALAAIIFTASTAHVYAATVGNTTSDAKVAFKPNTGPVKPVDPEDGKTPVSPETPGVPGPTSPPVTSGDGLSLDYVPALNFGTHYVDAAKAHTWNAYAADNGSGKAIPQFMQVTDNRGTAAGPAGWSVSLKQEAQFKGATAGDLSNAVLTFNADGTNKVVSASGNKAFSAVNTAKNVLVPGTAVNIFQADAGTGTGTNLLSFGAKDGSSLIKDPEALNTDNTTKKVDPNITLNVPAGSARTDIYKTTLTWNLYSAPGNT